VPIVDHRRAPRKSLARALGRRASSPGKTTGKQKKPKTPKE